LQKMVLQNSGLKRAPRFGASPTGLNGGGGKINNVGHRYKSRGLESLPLRGRMGQKETTNNNPPKLVVLKGAKVTCGHKSVQDLKVVLCGDFQPRRGTKVMSQRGKGMPRFAAVKENGGARNRSGIMVGRAPLLSGEKRGNIGNGGSAQREGGSKRERTKKQRPPKPRGFDPVSP